MATLGRNRSIRSGLILLAGIALLAAALVVHAILLETVTATWVLAGAGALLAAIGAIGLRHRLAALAHRRRAESCTGALDGVRRPQAVVAGAVRHRHGGQREFDPAG